MPWTQWESFVRPDPLDYALFIIDPTVFDVGSPDPSYRAGEWGCVQHLRTIQIGLTDHKAVAVDIGETHPYCSPREAWANPPFDVWLNENPPVHGPGTDTTRIASPGDMQWFRVRLRGSNTVSILLLESALDFEVYLPNDLSTPVAQFAGEGDPELGLKYAIPGDEFYIRVFSLEPEFTGDYQLRLHQHNCVREEEACILWPNGELVEEVIFPEGQTRGSAFGTAGSDEAWFDVLVNAEPSTRELQTLMFFAQSARDEAFEFTLFDDSGRDVVLDMNARPLSPGEWRHERLQNGRAKWKLRVARLEDHRDERFELPVGWDTDLSLIHGAEHSAGPMWLICDDETDGFLGNELGSDEIELRFDIDDTGYRTVYSSRFDCNGGGVRRVLDDEIGVIGYLETLRIRIREEDDSSPDDPAQQLVLNPMPAGFPRIYPPPTQGGPPPTEIPVPWPYLRLPAPLAVDNVWEWEGGQYRILFNMSRRRNHSSR